MDVYIDWRDNRASYSCDHSIRPYYGYPRITDRLREEGLVVHHKKVYRLMKELDIKSVIGKKRKYFGKDASNVYPKLLNR